MPIINRSQIQTASPGMIYRSGKNFVRAVGLSCAFRQWRAINSHCRFIHGYALEIDLQFGSQTLDERGWVQDFGGLKSFRAWIEAKFDHKLVVASDDPQISMFREMEIAGMCELTILPAVGCEAFARVIFEGSKEIFTTQLESVIVREHEANWASYGRDDFVGVRK